MTMANCTHFESAPDAPPSGTGCVECLATGGRWVHLRRCLECGHIGCCDSSPGKHATAHFHETQHPLVQSFEPHEEWFFCYLDNAMFEVPGQTPSPAHP